MAVLRGICCGFILAATLALLSGCGKKGPLVPPEALVPAPVTNLALAQKDGRFQVRWSAPSKQEGGAALKDLAGFLLFKRVVLPPNDDCEECATAYGEPVKIEIEYPKAAKRSGNFWVYDDRDLTTGKLYQYKLRSFTTAGVQSKDSNRVRRTAAIPPLPPVLEAASSAEAVTLSFVGLPPEQGTPAGYNIYRSKKGEEFPLFPLNATPVTANNYIDHLPQFGVPFSYAVTSVATVGEETVESAPSNVAEGSLTLPE
ncbi:lipoprotein, putative [Citrifermentans bemidjiense Bem]|uniref:Lipoprotein, putative n=1 Tax=Citrifermentans bemidjiense (strain ATCC BAA-1014 / DSM 16622 / JCM 12645 / Bem) TaxID=404380 RepID=B5ED17_CITBB|nr:lipoprotein [Citrifermentans bemidjiense]ACH40634.2 lipoprotein, putative [Citrifermentans bemidjiense Bem]